MNDRTKSLHADEGDLVRLLDRQGDDAEAAAVREHLRVCDECSLRFDELRHASNAFKHQIAQDRFPIPANIPASRVSQDRPRTWRIAAGILLLLAATSAFQPVRAWMATGWQTVVGIFAGPTEIVDDVPASSIDIPPTGTVISFVPRSTRVFIDVSMWQADGELTIVTTDDTSVSAQVLSPNASEHMAIVPSGGITIANAANSVSDYRITVPSHLALVTVRVAGARIVEFAPASGRQPTVVSLIQN